MQLIHRDKVVKIVSSFVTGAGVGVTGGTLTVGMWRTSDGYWWSGVGWQETYTTFTPYSEQGQGWYVWELDTDGLVDDDNPEEVLCIRVILSDGSGTPLSAIQETSLVVGGIADEIRSARKALLNGRQIDQEHYQEVLFDDDGEAEVMRWNLYGRDELPATTNVFHREVVTE
jgi:hypothetical protein